MTLETKLARLEAIEGMTVSIGRGPFHPTQPNHDVEEITREYFDAFPQAKEDHMYVDFMYKYSGMFLHDTACGIVVDVFGFGGESSRLEIRDAAFLAEGESNILAKGFLFYCDATFVKERKDAQEFGTPQAYISNLFGVGFGFDVTGQRQRGIYRCMQPADPEFAMVYYCAGHRASIGNLNSRYNAVTKMDEAWFNVSVAPFIDIFRVKSHSDKLDEFKTIIRR